MDRDGHYKIQEHRLEQSQRQKLMLKGIRRAIARAELAEVEIYGSE